MKDIEIHDSVHESNPMPSSSCNSDVHRHVENCGKWQFKRCGNSEPLLLMQFAA
jgi:hypothetical protein